MPFQFLEGAQCEEELGDARSGPAESVMPGQDQQRPRNQGSS